jgi:hypothetical protein
MLTEAGALGPSLAAASVLYSPLFLDGPELNRIPAGAAAR